MYEQPADVAVPEVLRRIVGIRLFVCMRMVADMVGAPKKGGVLNGPSPHHQQAGLHPGMTLEAAMGHHAVITHRDPHAGYDVEDGEQDPI